MASRIKNWIAGVGQRHLDRASIAKASAVTSPPVLSGAFRQVNSKVFTPPDRNAANALATYETNPFVHVVVDRVASKFAGQEWHLKRRNNDDGKKITDHPAISFMESGSEIMDGYQSRKLISSHLDLAGETFLLIGYDSDGKPASYLPIPPNWVTEVAYRDGGEFVVHIPRTTYVAKIPWRGVIWLKRARPSDPTGRGFSATMSLLTEIALHDELATFFYSFVRNRARPDIIITGTAEDPLNADDAKALEARWLQQHGGPANAGRPMISNVPLGVTEVGLTMQESQANEMRKLGRDFILQVYGVQPSVFGVIENANRATADAADYSMARDVIEPRLKAHSEGMYSRLLVEFPDLVRYRLCFDSPVAEDKEFTLNVIRAAPSGFKNDDARRLAGLEPDPERGQEYLKEHTVDLGGTANGDPNALADGNTDSNKKKLLPRSAQLLTRALTSDQVDELVAGLDDNEDSILLLLTAMLRSSAIQAAMDLSVDRSVQLDAVIRDVEEWSRERASQLLGFINETSADALRKALSVAGDDRALIGGAILVLFAEWERERALLIGSTEANGAMSAAEAAIAKATGATSKVWITQADERVRGLHRPMHGQVRAIGEDFVAPNGEQGPAPGRFQTAKMNAGCRCGTRSFSGEDPSSEALAGMAATHDRSLSLIEAVAANGVRSVFAAQQRAILQRLGGIR